MLYQKEDAVSGLKRAIGDGNREALVAAITNTKKIVDFNPPELATAEKALELLTHLTKAIDSDDPDDLMASITSTKKIADFSPPELGVAEKALELLHKKAKALSSLTKAIETDTQEALVAAISLSKEITSFSPPELGIAEKALEVLETKILQAVRAAQEKSAAVGGLEQAIRDDNPDALATAIANTKKIADFFPLQLRTAEKALDLLKRKAEAVTYLTYAIDNNNWEDLVAAISLTNEITGFSPPELGTAENALATLMAKLGKVMEEIKRSVKQTIIQLGEEVQGNKLLMRLSEDVEVVDDVTEEVTTALENRLTQEVVSALETRLSEVEATAVAVYISEASKEGMSTLETRLSEVEVSETAASEVQGLPDYLKIQALRDWLQPELDALRTEQLNLLAKHTQTEMVILRTTCESINTDLEKVEVAIQKGEQKLEQLDQELKDLRSKAMKKIEEAMASHTKSKNSGFPKQFVFRTESKFVKWLDWRIDAVKMLLPRIRKRVLPRARHL